MPTAWVIIKEKDAIDTDSRLVLTSRNSIVDQHLYDIIELLGLPFELVQNVQKGSVKIDYTVRLPRWDKLLILHRKVSDITGYVGKLTNARPEEVHYIPGLDNMPAEKTPEGFYRPLEGSPYQLIRHLGLAPASLQLLSAMPSFLSACNVLRAEVPLRISEIRPIDTVYRNCVLVLNRSQRDIPGYASVKSNQSASRAFTDSEWAVDNLNSLGIKATIFEPGAHSITEQISAFSECSGVLAMRGAELTHILWLNSGCRVLVGNPMAGTTPLKSIANLYGIRLNDFKCANIDEFKNHQNTIEKFFST